MTDVCSPFLDQAATIDWLITIVGVAVMAIIGLTLWLMLVKADCALLQAELDGTRPSMEPHP